MQQIRKAVIGYKNFFRIRRSTSGDSCLMSNPSRFQKGFQRKLFVWFLRWRRNRRGCWISGYLSFGKFLTSNDLNVFNNWCKPIDIQDVCYYSEPIKVNNEGLVSVVETRTWLARSRFESPRPLLGLQFKHSPLRPKKNLGTLALSDIGVVGWLQAYK